MDADAFSSLLRKPYLLKEYSFSELQNLSHQYPYSSAINALIVLKAHQENDSSYEHYLHQAAIRVPDRKRLYHLIHSYTDVEDVGQELLENLGTVEPIVSVIESREAIIPSKEPEPQETESLIKVSIPEEEEKPVVKRNEVEMPVEKEEEKPLELPGIGEAVEALKSISQAEDLPIEEAPEKVDETKAVQDDSNEHSFTGWLSLLKNKQEEKKEPPVLKEIQESASKNEIEFSKDTKLSATDEAAIAQKAKESLSDDMEWVTETLAKIYELQKKYDKAEEAYRMLSLKFPDKKAYFAQRIENLKKFRA